MAAGGFVDSVDLTNILLVLGFVGIVIKQIGEGRGWFRNAAALRIENTDLLRRNGELEEDIERRKETGRTQAKTIDVLEEKVRDLEQRDQVAVLAALRDHETSAERRHQENADRHTEALAIWTSIRDTLKEAS